MSTYSLPELLKLWAQGKLTAEQAIGHLCQQLALLTQRVKALEDRLHQLENLPPG